MRSFWDKVDQSAGPDGCWPWTGGRDKDGYGKTRWDGKHCRAHRVALYLTTDRWGEQSCHRCDNTNCCNPAHLYWGTNSSNMRDRAARSWRPPSQWGSSAKLTHEAVAVIRTRRAKGEKLRVLASDFGVSEAAISMAARGVTWA